MFQFNFHDVFSFILAFFGGGGLGIVAVKLYIKSEAQEALKGSIEELKAEDEALHSRINHIENTYVACKYCDMQHSNLERTLQSMDGKLDILIGKKSGGK